ncbi:T9SS type A sorting domain-containing protein [candidate division WOR-3 bacterium]|nr:T9SS type A sorting domain-containing protein [candidate division WOR-3 bacterium]
MIHTINILIVISIFPSYKLLGPLCCFEFSFPLVRSIAADSATTIFAGTRNGGVYRSTDNGDTWELLTPTTTWNAYSLAISTNNDVFCGTDYGIRKSTDMGNSWSLAGLPTHRVRAIAIDPDGAIFIGTSFDSTSIVYRSTDNGTSWDSISPNWYNTWINDFAFNSSGDIFVALEWDIDDVFHSTDNGNSWTSTGFNRPTRTVMVDVNDNIFAGTQDFSGIHYSTDNGTTWNHIITTPYVNSFARNSNNDLFAGTYYEPPIGGVYRSTDDGISWQMVNNGLLQRYVTSLSINQQNGYIYAGTYDQGVFRSTDNGETWVYVLGIAENNNANIRTMNQKTVCYPSPFKNTTTIHYHLVHDSDIKIAIFNLTGQRIRTLVNILQTAGKYHVTWDGKNKDGEYVSNGIYVYHIETNTYTEAATIILAR